MERRNLTYEENKKANLLCVVSLVLMFAPLLLYCVGLEIADTYLNIDFTGSIAVLIIACGIALNAAWGVDFYKNCKRP
ncbi:MAG: hypothetical protein ACLRTZ_06655 [Agathobacter sp.]|jgi:uncharacterized membrane protein|nr:unknown [Roseburia sp. CAG:197]